MAIFGVFHGFFGFLVCVSSLFVAYDEVFLCCFCYWCDWMGFCRGFGRYFILVVEVHSSLELWRTVLLRKKHFWNCKYHKITVPTSVT